MRPPAWAPARGLRACRSRRTPWWLVAAAPLGCGDGGGSASSDESWAADEAILVVAEPAAARRMADVVEAVGTTLANESLTITAKVTDEIRQVFFDDGDFAAAGDVLVELTDEEQAAQLAEAAANVDDAEAQHERLRDLLQQGSVSIADVDEARARLSAMKARQQAILARLDDRLIRAPFAGLLGFRQVSAGALITPGAPITTLDDISIIKLDFPIPEVLLAAVRPGLALTAESAAYPQRAFAAEVQTVGSRVNPATRAVPVRARIDNADLLLRPGMMMTVRLAIADRDALTVPETALLRRGGQTFVYAIGEDDRAIATIIDAGARRDGWIEVRSGLTAGQLIISEGVVKVRNGVRVRLAESAGAGG